MANILFLTELLPWPLVSGAKIRAYYVLRKLAEGHGVTLVSFVRGDDRAEDVAHLGSFLEAVHTVPMRRSRLRDGRALAASVVTGRPVVVEREEIGAMRRRVEGLLASGRFDAVHADQIPMARYGLLGRDGDVRRRVLDQHNATFQLVERMAARETNPAKRWLMRREARAFRRYEAEVCGRYDAVTFVTEEDRQALLGLPGGERLNGRTAVIPICVDAEAVGAVRPAATANRVTHVGTMYWPPNVEGLLWFREEVWPRVRAAVPGARLTLIGKNPAERIRALDGEAGVEVAGYVEELGPTLAETAVFVVPLHAGGGMRVKIVDAWCWGLPIVSTSIGAEGIEVRDGENVLIADEPEAFAEAVVRVMQDAALQARLRAQGRAWVEARYDWRRVYGAWDEVYERLLGA
jgi:glycosyltransferase involved in cell wall biosynthesis